MSIADPHNQAAEAEDWASDLALLIIAEAHALPKAAARSRIAARLRKLEHDAGCKGIITGSTHTAKTLSAILDSFAGEGR